MKTLKQFISESQWMYHGSQSHDITHLKPDRGDTLLDRAIGSHFAADIAVSNKFKDGLYSRTEPKPGAMYRTKAPPRSQLEVIHQKRFKNRPYKAWRTDQTAIAAHVTGTVFSQPEHKEMFKSWAMHSRGIDEPTAELLHKHLSSGKAPACQKTFGCAASKGSSSFKSYMSNFDPSLIMKPHEDFGKDVVHKYLDIMKKKGKVGLVYKNTSPSETKDIRSHKSYVLFHPENHPLEKID